MIQRVFDVENEKDMQDLWNILPDNLVSVEKKDNYGCILIRYENGYIDELDIFKIRWHDKTEITRPIPEATEQDIGKLCYFWDYDEEKESGTGSFGKLCIIDEHKVEGTKYQGQNIGWFPHCRRLTKQEIEELC